MPVGFSQFLCTDHLCRDDAVFEQKAANSYRLIECKSAKRPDHDIYETVRGVVDELYRDLHLRPENSFSSEQKLSLRDEVFIRHVAIYLCHVVLGHSMRKIAKGFDLDRTTISYACHKIEDKRDHMCWDRFISLCERLIGLLNRT